MLESMLKARIQLYGNMAGLVPHTAQRLGKVRDQPSALF